MSSLCGNGKKAQSVHIVRGACYGTVVTMKRGQGTEHCKYSVIISLKYFSQTLPGAGNTLAMFCNIIYFNY